MHLRSFFLTALLGTTSLMTYSQDGAAHTRSKGKSTFHLNQDGFLKIQIGMTTLDFLDLADIDLGSPNATDKDEIAAEQFLLRYLPKYLRVQLLPSDKKCPVKFKSLELTDHKNIELFAFAKCPKEGLEKTKEMRIDWGLFTGTILMHRSFASFFWQEKLQHNWVFSRQESKKILPITTPSFLGTSLSFFKEGFWHFTTGYDHICFLILLFLISIQMRPLVLLVSGFTVAHGISLALSYFDLVRVPALAVEVGIALSIIISAIHLLRQKEDAHRKLNLDKRLFAIVLFFGLIHGLGFATLLKELLQESPYLWTGLLGFHIGLELAQLLFLAVFLVGTLKIKNQRQWPAMKKLLAISCGLAGLYWVIERLS